MLSRILTAAAFTLGMTTASQAATIQVGGIDVETGLFADVAVNTNTFGAALPMVGSNFSTSTTVATGNPFIVTFVNNTFANKTDFDLYIYEAGAAEAPTVMINGTTVSGVTPFLTDSSGVLAPVINIWAFELSDFGIAEGGSANGFLLTNTGGNSPEIFAAAAVNGVVIPLPASGLLLAGGLGLFAAARRRR